MGTITGTNGSDSITGTSANDIINSGNGDDFVNGGAGSDQINGGAGDDTLIYCLAENVGGYKDVYTGGSGIDTVRLLLTYKEWCNSEIRVELERYVKFLTTVKMNPQGEVSNGSASDFVFTFGTSTLTVQMMEKLAVWVQPEVGGDYAPIDYRASLITGVTAGTAVEAGGIRNSNVGMPTVSGQLRSDDLDGADNVFKSVNTGAAAKYGTYTVTTDGQWSYSLNNADSRVQELRANDVLSDTITVYSADGSAKVIEITIKGSNDAPEVTAALTGGTAEGYGAYTLNLLAGASDVDRGETATLRVTNVSYKVDDVTVVDVPSGIGLSGNTLSVNPKDGSFDHLAVGEKTTIVVYYKVMDAQGATVDQSATITINGSNDVPTVNAKLTSTAAEGSASFALNLLDGASDVDHGETATLHVTDLSYQVDGVTVAEVPSGVSLSGNTLSVNPVHPAFDHLAVGAQTTIVVTYKVQDAQGATVEQSATITITGTNDAPVVGGALTSTKAEGNGAFTMNLLAGASDADDGETATLNVKDVSFSVDDGAASANAPAGVSLAGNTLSVNPSNNAFDHLAVGEKVTIVVSYKVMDAQGATVAQSATITIAGTNDAPTVSGSLTSVKAEGTGSYELNLLEGASDLDHGETVSLSVTGVTYSVDGVASAGVPAGISLVGHTLNVNPADGTFDHLAEGMQSTIAVHYFVKDAQGATVAQSATITIAGTNDAPVVTGAVTGSATEDGATVTLNALANASDVDAGTTLAVGSVPAILPAGVSYNALTHSFTLDPGHADYQSLAQGQTKEVTVSYQVSDGITTTPASVTFTVTGTNDAPVVMGAVTGSANEDGATVALNALANVSDVDDGTTLAVESVPAELPQGVSYDALTHSFTLDPGHADYQSLAQGQTKKVTVSYQVSDGIASTPASVTFTVTGTNDAPVVTGAVTGSANEDGATVALNALANSSDVDAGTTLAVESVPAELPQGVSYDALTHSFTLDPSHADYQSLAQDQTKEVTVSYQVSDGITTTSASVTFTVTGTNDAPVVTGAVTGSANEDGTTVTLNALANASDVDASTTLALESVPAELPPGVSYDALTHSFTLDPSHADYQSLAQGQTNEVTVSYQVSDGITTTPASVTFTVTGTNDAPVVTGAVTGNANEDGASVTLNALANASDVDDGTALAVESVPAVLPSGVSYTALTHSFTLDPSHADYQSLAQGQTKEVTISYQVSDGITSTPASVTFTVTGTNDAPAVTGAVTGSATEDGASVTLNALANASDVDDGTTLAVESVPAVLPSGVSYDGATHSFTLDPSHADYQSLAQGQTKKVSVSYQVSDGITSTPASVAFTVTGTNDAPVVTGAVTGSATEDGASVMLNALANASDVDASTIMTVESTPAVMPSGVSYDAQTHSFTLDPSHAEYQSLAQGQTKEVTVSYQVSDGITTTPASVTFTVTGANDAPVVTGAVKGNANEDGASVTLNALASASDVDDGTTLAVESVPAVLPAGVNYDGATHSFTLDPSHADYQSLAQGQTKEVTVSYQVSDGITTTPASVTFIVTGTNDAPVVTGAVTGNANEDGASVMLNALANASDVDDGTTLAVESVPAVLPAGVSYDGATHSFTLDPNHADYQSLAQGQTKEVTVNYQVSDGITTTSASVTFTVAGANDAPVVTGAVTGSATEDGASVTLNALANVSDVDDGTTFAVESVPAVLPSGVSYNALTHSFILDPSHADYQSLAQGQTKEVTISYQVSDGITSTPASVTFTVTGTDDAPAVTSAVTGSANEDSAIVTLNALANASDVDDGTTLAVESVPAVLPSGVSYDGATHSFTLDPSHADYQSLAQGQTKKVSVSYQVSDGITSTPASVAFTVTGTNDAPVVTGAVTGSAPEDGASVTLNALANASDVDNGSTLAVVSVPGTVPAGVTYNAGTHSFTLDPSHSAYQSLAAGHTLDVTVNYGVSDGVATTPGSVKFTVTGTNDAPVVTGAVTGNATEDGASVTLNALANASDVDTGTTLSVVSVPGALPAGVSYNAGTHSFTLDPSHSAYQSLAAGQTLDVTVNFGVSDGVATTPGSVKFTVTGTNDAPVVTGAVTGSATEDGASVTLNALANASDVDAGSTLSVVSVPGTLPAGVTYNAGTHSFTLDPSHSAYQSLAAGQTLDVTVNYGVSDGVATTPGSVKFTVAGTNDAPVVTGAVTGSATEDGASVTLNALANASDVDTGTTLSVVSVPGTLPAGVTYNAGTHSFTLDPSHSAYQSLAAGQTLDVTVNYGVSDGLATTPGSVKFTVAGTNDAPVVTGAVTGSATEDGVSVTLNALANASDVDAGSTLSVVSVPGTLPAGVTYNAGTHSFTLDPSHSAYQSLAAGQTLDVTVNYGLSDGVATTPGSVKFTVSGINDAPVLNAAATPVLTNVIEDAGAPSGAVGTLVSNLINLNPPVGGLDNVSDADSGAITGIALTGTNVANGSWWYSTNGGTNWTAVGAVSNSSALLLSADANTRLYFQGGTDFNGTVSDGLTFRAWDRTSGTAGTMVNTTSNGGSTAFSTATDTASITVVDDNYPPVATADRVIVSSSTTVTISTSALLGNDTDIDGAALVITGVGAASGISNLALTSAGITFKSGSTAGNSVGSFQYTVSDGRGGTATGTVAIDVRAVTSSSSSGDTVDLSGAGTYQASYIDADNGSDTVTGGAAGDNFYGGSGNAMDILRGSAGNDLLVGEGGNDDLSGGAGNDVLRGGSGDDVMDGGDGSEDMLDFSDGSALSNFTLVQSTNATNTNGAGGLGNDSYKNMEGVIGSSSSDIINGSAGNDIIRGGGGNDALDGKGGNDLLDFSDATAGITFTMGPNGAGTFTASGLGTDTYSGFEGVIGTAFADTLTGLAVADELRGGAGNDTINGLAGDDRIVGGAGADTLTGGADNDTFVFDTAPNAVDTITDFNASGSAASGDTIELSLAVFTAITTPSGNVLSSSEFASSAEGGVTDVVAAGVRVIYDSVTGNLYYDADGQGAAGRTLVAKLVLTDPADTFDYNDIKLGS